MRSLVAPGRAAEVRKQLSIIEEIPAQDFGHAEDEMSVGYGLEDFFAKPLAEFHYTLLMT